MNNMSGNTSFNKHLFQLGDFTSHSGLPLKWKIECEALTWRDWDCLAQMMIEREHFKCRAAYGIPRGGNELAYSLNKNHATKSPEDPLWIVDDVFTTGKSFKDFEEEKFPGLPVGVIKKWCVFARKKPPEMSGVKALFVMGE